MGCLYLFLVLIVTIHLHYHVGLFCSILWCKSPPLHRSSFHGMNTSSRVKNSRLMICDQGKHVPIQVLIKLLNPKYIIHSELLSDLEAKLLVFQTHPHNCVITLHPLDIQMHLQIISNVTCGHNASTLLTLSLLILLPCYILLTNALGLL